MKLKGLKALFLGDSITYGSGASSLDKNYVNLLAKYTGLNTVNYGVGGTRIARQTKASACTDWDYDFNARARIMDKDADIIGVFGGTNDYGHGFAPIGKPTDTDEYTFYGLIPLENFTLSWPNNTTQKLWLELENAGGLRYRVLVDQRTSNQNGNMDFAVPEVPNTMEIYSSSGKLLYQSAQSYG